MSCETSSIDLNMEHFDDGDDEIDAGPEKQEFLAQIAQLQEAVETMKNAFTTAQLQLASVGLEDKSLHDELLQTKADCQQQTGEILRLVLALKSEIIALRETLETTQLIQHGLGSRLQATLMERDLLLQELTKNGAISEQLRDKLLRCRGRNRSRNESNGGGADLNVIVNGAGGGAGAGRSSSGSQSTNDSGVAFAFRQECERRLSHGSNLDHDLDHLLDESRGHDHDINRNRIGGSGGVNGSGSGPSSSSNSANNLSGELPGQQPNGYHHHVESYLNTLNVNSSNDDNNIRLNNIISRPRPQDPRTHTSNRSHHNGGVGDVENENDYPSLNSSQHDDDDDATESSSTSLNNGQHEQRQRDEAAHARGPGRILPRVYDHGSESDSSLTVAAAAALSLSNSLSKQCGLELDHQLHQNRDRERENAKSGGAAKDATSEQQQRVRTTRQDVDDDDVELDDNSNSSSDDVDVDGDTEANEPTQKAAGGPIRKLSVDTSGGSLVLSYEELQRHRVAKELVETERKYCRTLKTIEDVFATPLRDSAILTMRDINTLFPEEVSHMHAQHCQLLAQLDQRISGWTNDSSVGDLIEGFTRVDGSNILRLYTSYVNDFPEVLKTFHKLCRTNADFTHFLKQCHENPVCGGLDLGAFLLTPVQRMPRYILLLKQMLKWTNSLHRDYENITVSLNRLRDYLTKLNDSMEHSFQLVTAQIVPHSQSAQSRSQSQSQQYHAHTPTHTNTSRGKVMTDGMQRQHDYFDRNHQRDSAIRTSTSSENSSTKTAEDEDIGAGTLKMRYKRSTSASANRPRTAITPSASSTFAPRRDSAGSLCSKINNKLRSRSKSDWVVSKKDNITANKYLYYEDEDEFAENESQNGTLTRQLLDRSISESDLNSDVEDTEKSRKKNIQFSKSLHDFSNPHNHNHGEERNESRLVLDPYGDDGGDDVFDWAISDPSLCYSDSKSAASNSYRRGSQISNGSPARMNGHGQTPLGKPVLRKKTLLRPFHPPPQSPSAAYSGLERQLVRIERGSQPELSLSGRQKDKKRSSLRASLKNLFSIKKRNSSRTFEISQPTSMPFSSGGMGLSSSGSSQSHGIWSGFSSRKSDSGTGGSSNVQLHSITMTNWE